MASNMLEFMIENVINLVHNEHICGTQRGMGHCEDNKELGWRRIADAFGLWCITILFNTILIIVWYLVQTQQLNTARVPKLDLGEGTRARGKGGKGGEGERRRDGDECEHMNEAYDYKLCVRFWAGLWQVASMFQTSRKHFYVCRRPRFHIDLM